MKLNNQKVLIAIAVIALLLFPLVTFTTGALRIVLGLIFIIFIPGYALLSALFPRKDDLGGVERIALSFGLSIALVPLLGLILNYTPWGIRLYPTLIAITLLIVVTTSVGWYRQRKLSESQRLTFAFKISLPNWTTGTRLDKILSISLAVAIVAALGCLGYVVANPKQGEKFTEFYLLGLGGKAEDYPRQVILGEPVDIVIVVVNHEYQPTSYRVGVSIDGIENSQVDIGRLAHEEKREQRVSFIPHIAGKNQRVEFYLYKNGEDIPCFDTPLHLYTDVGTFYILGTDGKAIASPVQVKQGEPVELIMGIANDEYQPTSYRVEIKTADILYKEINTETLAHLENWQQKVSFVPWILGKSQKVEFWLYRGGQLVPYYKEPLYLHLDVISPQLLNIPCEGAFENGW